VAANRMRRRLSSEHKVVLVERRDEFFYAPSFLWVMVGARRPAQTKRALRSMLAPGVELVHGEVSQIDAAGHKVVAGGREVPFDYLVVALGAELAPQATPGFQEAALNHYELEGAARALPALRGLSSGNVVVAVCGVPYKCPAAPWETALLADDLLRHAGKRGSVNVSVFTPEPAPMPVAGPAVGKMVTGLLHQRGIEAYFNAPIAGFDAAGKRFLLKDRTARPFDLALGVPAHRPPAAVAASGIAGPAGWASVDPRTLETAAPGVFAVGDVASITLPNGKPLPKAGVFAHAQAHVVADAIAARIEGTSPRREFDGEGWCFLETGAGRAGFASGNFYAQPDPQVALRDVGRRWHWGKEVLDWYLMGGRLRRSIAGLALATGSRLFNVPVEM